MTNRRTTKIQLKRRCVGCGAEAPKGAFLRVVRSPDGSIVAPADSKTQGRGAYICRDAECIAAARKKNALARSLHHEVEQSIYDLLEAMCRDEN